MSEKTTVALHFDIERVTVVRRAYQEDIIYLNLTDDIARTIHGEFYPVFRGANLRLHVTHGQAEAALEGLGVTSNIVEIIEA